MVFPVHLADADPGAARSCFGRDWLLAIPHLPGSRLGKLPTESCFRRAGSFFLIVAALSPGFAAVGLISKFLWIGRGRHDVVDDLGAGCDALLPRRMAV